MTKTKKMPFQGNFVLEIGIWSLEFVWNLVLGIWNLSLPIASFLTVYRRPSTDCFHSLLALPLPLSLPLMPVRPLADTVTDTDRHVPYGIDPKYGKISSSRSRNIMFPLHRRQE
jgi:hypothetical protein